jgi:hypothetical protein
MMELATYQSSLNRIWSHLALIVCVTESMKKQYSTQGESTRPQYRGIIQRTNGFERHSIDTVDGILSSLHFSP